MFLQNAPFQMIKQSYEYAPVSISEYFTLHSSSKHHHTLRYSETANTQVSDSGKEGKLLENVFELAAVHQKKEWAKTSKLERDYMGYRCQDSSNRFVKTVNPT